MSLQHYANLHTHSTHSDGVYTPEQLVDIAKAEGYGALAVTDHDTITACEPVRRACEARGDFAEAEIQDGDCARGSCEARLRRR